MFEYSSRWKDKGITISAMVGGIIGNCFLFLFDTLLLISKGVRNNAKTAGGLVSTA
jgi:hypothetical protein